MLWLVCSRNPKLFGGRLISTMCRALRSLTKWIARAQISQDVTANFSDSLRELMNPELAAIFRKVMFEQTKLNPVETTQITIYFNLTVSTLRDAFNAVRDGMIDERVLDSLSNNVCWYLTAPVFVQEWRRVQHVELYDPKFVAYVNARFAKLYPDRDATLLSPGVRGERA